MTERKFYKTKVEIEILSEEPIDDEPDLGTIHYNITEGDWSGHVSVKSTKELTGKQAAKALEKQGSDPEFFGLTNEGEDI